jgi:hypothetical protein
MESFFFSNTSTNGFSMILDFIEDPNESAIDVHRNAREILNKYDLNIDGLTAVGADNTNVNMGDHHSVFSLFRDKKPNVLKDNSIYIPFCFFVLGFRLTL